MLIFIYTILFVLIFGLFMGLLLRFRFTGKSKKAGDITGVVLLLSPVLAFVPFDSLNWYAITYSGLIVPLIVLFWVYFEEWAECGKHGKLWHALSFAIRSVPLMLLIQLIGNHDWQLFALFGFIYLWLAWVGYDAFCNLLRPLEGNFFQRFFYSGTKQSGTGSVIDRLLGEYLPFIKLAWTIISIIAIIYLSTTS